jgi:hypothetical protein
MLSVVTKLHMVGLITVALCMDAGGGNSNLYRILRIQKKYDAINTDDLCPDDVVSMIHPCDERKRIYFFHCFVHCK